MTKAGDSNGKPAKSGSRNKRLAAALRENLRRRKAQARGRGKGGTTAAQTAGGAAEDGQQD